MAEVKLKWLCSYNNWSAFDRYKRRMGLCARVRPVGGPPIWSAMTPAGRLIRDCDTLRAAKQAVQEYADGKVSLKQPGLYDRD